MNEELNVYFSSKNRIPRKYLLLFLILGISSSLCPFFLAEPDTPELWCINWNAILGQISLYARLAAFVIIGYLRNYFKRYGALRILLYIAFVSFVSYFIVAHGLDHIAMTLWNWFEGNVLRRLDDSIIVIDENRNETTSMRRIGEKPKSIEEHFRYNNEDVKFLCYDIMTFDLEVEPADIPVIWKHNGKLVVPSEKVLIEFSFVDITVENSSTGERNSTQYTYLTESSLTIYLVENADYGSYTCHLRPVAKLKPNVNPKEGSKKPNPKSRKKPIRKPENNRQFSGEFSLCICMCISIEDIVRHVEYLVRHLEDVVRHVEYLVRQMEDILSQFYEDIEILLQNQKCNEHLRNIMTYEWTGEFKLTKINKTVQTVSAPPGGIVSVSASYLNLAEKQDISLDYLINGEAFHNVYNGHSHCCSVFVWTYWVLWHARGYFGTIPDIILYSFKMQSSILGNAWQCACPSSYGIHIFGFYRHFYNVTSGREEIIEVEHPRSIKLVPRPADILLAFENDSQPLPIGVECFDSVPLVGSCSWLEYAVSELHKNYFFIEGIIFLLLFVLGTSITYFFTEMTLRLVVTGRNIILEGPFWPRSWVQETKKTLGNIGQTGVQVKYDVYISHADSQWNQASELATKLESFGKKVYYRDRDLTVGDIKTESVADAIVSSRRFLIIVSREYIDGEFQNGYEFPLMLCQIHEKRVSEKCVMLVKYGPCSIPTYFSNFTNMKILDMTALCPEELHQEVNVWLTGHKLNNGLSVITFIALCVFLGMGFSADDILKVFMFELKVP